MLLLPIDAIIPIDDIKTRWTLSHFRLKSGLSNEWTKERTMVYREFYLSGFRRYRHRIYQSIRFLPTMLPSRLPTNAEPVEPPAASRTVFPPFRPTHSLELIQIPMSHATTANPTMRAAGRQQERLRKCRVNESGIFFRESAMSAPRVHIQERMPTSNDGRDVVEFIHLKIIYF